MARALAIIALLAVDWAVPVQSLVTPGTGPAGDAPEGRMVSMLQMPLAARTHLVRMPKSKVKALRSERVQAQVANMALASAKLAMTTTAHLRHLMSAVFRQVRLDRNSKYAGSLLQGYHDYSKKDLAMTKKGWSGARGAASAARYATGTPDTHGCKHLIKTVRDGIQSRADRKTLDQYLEWLVPGKDGVDGAVYGCFLEDAGNEAYARLYLSLGNKAVENIVLRALEDAGNEEILGTRGPTPMERQLGQVREDFLRQSDILDM